MKFIKKVISCYRHSTAISRTGPPKTLVLSITKECNFSCRYCFPKIYGNLQNVATPVTLMGPHQGYELLKEGYGLGCREFSFCGVGEPTTHPFFYQFLAWAKEIGYSISFASNGWNLDPLKLAMLDDRDVVKISVDTMHFRGSPEPESYCKKIKRLFFCICRIRKKIQNNRYITWGNKFGPTINNY